MKYGTTLLVLGVLDIITIFSGLPTGWKKALIVTISLIIMTIGWILRTLNQKRALRTEIQREIIEEIIEQEITSPDAPESEMEKEMHSQ